MITFMSLVVKIAFMIKQKKRYTKLKTKGFILAEAVFAVFITLIVVLILQNLLKSLTLANKVQHRTDDIVFSYVQLNRFIKEKQNVKAFTLPERSNSEKAVFKKIDAQGKDTIYRLTQYKNMLRVTTPEGGHMPLLLDVKRSSFTTNDRMLKIEVTETDGRKSELYFKFNSRPIKNEKEKVLNDRKQKTKIKS